MRAHIKTYGCTLNQADGDMMAGILEREGFELSGEMDGADLVVVNTCTVKKPTEQKILNLLGRLEKGGRKVIVTGCLASANRDLVERHAPGASIVTTSNIDCIGAVAAAAMEGRREVAASPHRMDKMDMFSGRGAVIAKVPVSEGCLSSCSFCETKFARGPLNSFQEDKIIKAIEMSAGMGAKEVQLTSQDTGAYGMDRSTNIAKLMEKVSRMRGDFKVRVGMLNPEHLDGYIEEFADALEGERFYSFVHLPVQSGSDAVLKAMRRNYTVGQFEGQLRYLRERVPGLTVETDIIVGYPTETEEDFEETLGLVRRTGMNVVNMSKFWERPHAAAGRLMQLPREEIVWRSAELGRVVRAVQQGINDRMVGKEVDVLVTEDEGKSINGRTCSYNKVILDGEPAALRMGRWVRARISRASCNVLYGRVAMEDRIAGTVAAGQVV